MTEANRQTPSKRVLIAGVGNALRGDDGFGVAVLERLRAASGDRAGIRLFESGIAGVDLVTELLEGYDVLIVLDAVDAAARPGTLVVFQPDVTGESTRGSGHSIDLHLAGPDTVLRMATALGVLPPQVWVVGCQRANGGDVVCGLSADVQEAVPRAVERVEQILASLDPSRPP